MIYFEAPHRILDALTDIAEILPDRPLVAARELTKLHEEFLRGSAVEVATVLTARPSIQGEFTLLIGKAVRTAKLEATPQEIRERVEALVSEGLSKKEAIKTVAKKLGLAKSAVYDTCLGE